MNETISQIKECVITTLPEFKNSQIAAITSGWKTLVLDIDNEWIVKIPRDDDSLISLKREAALVKYVREKVRFLLPERTHLKGEIDFFLHRKMKGHTLTRKNVCALNRQHYSIASQSIAEMFYDLHQIHPKNIGALASNFEHKSIDLFYLEQHLPKGLWRRHKAEIERIVVSFNGNNHIDHRRFGLFDFHAGNFVVYGRSKRLKGVFDLDELGVGNMYFNFRELYLHYGPAFMSDVVCYYEEMSHERIDRDYLNLCFIGWYLFEFARICSRKQQLRTQSGINFNRYKNLFENVIKSYARSGNHG